MTVLGLCPCFVLMRMIRKRRHGTANESVRLLHINTVRVKACYK